MTHLPDDIDELKESVEGSVITAQAPEPAPPDEESWTFSFAHADVRGAVWTGQFTNEILDLERQGYVAVMRSRLQGGQPFESIDPSIADLNMAIAHMSYSLKERPAWAKNLLKIRDPEVVVKLWAKVRAHEDRYFRRPETP